MARLVALALLASSAAGANLSISTLSIPAGSTGVASLSLSSGGETVTGMQFDMRWDAAIDLHMTEGAQLGSAGKLVYATPVGQNQMRFVIAGLNQTGIPDGEVLRIFAFPNASAAPGTLQILANNAAAVNAEGDSVSLAPASAAVQVLPSAPFPMLSQSLINAADFLAGPVSPGEIVTLLGQIGSPIDSSAPPVLLFNGVSAPVIYADAFQINAVVPFELDTSIPAQVEIQNAGQSAGTWILPTAPATPAIFVQNGTGLGPGAILNQDLTFNTYSNPAAKGSVIMVYGTGFGTIRPSPQDGQPAPALAYTTSPVTATIDGVEANVLYSGSAPSLLSGLIQINIEIPKNVRPNLSAALQLSVAGVSTPYGVTVAIE